MKTPIKLIHNIVIIFIFVRGDYTLKKETAIRQSIIVKVNRVERK